MADKTKAEMMDEVRMIRDAVAEMPEEQVVMLLVFLQIDLEDRGPKRGRPKGSKNKPEPEPVNGEN